MRNPRSVYKTVLAMLCVALSSCAPTIHYLGEAYEPSTEVEVYYDEKDVKKEYKVIGKMTNDKMVDYNVEVVKAKMIEKAKQAGGDGIIFTDIGVERSETDGDRLAVKATLIRYI